MKAEITRFLRKELPRFGLSCHYQASRDTFLIHKEGRMLQGFSTKVFYSIPKRERANMFEPLLKIGLAANLGNANNANLFLERRVGKKVV